MTAPELTPLFGATLAQQVSPWLKDPALAGHGQVVLEVGGGSGMLAAQLLNALDNVGHHDVRYLILELSAERREHQRQTLKSLAPGLMDRVGWLDTFLKALPVWWWPMSCWMPCRSSCSSGGPTRRRICGGDGSGVGGRPVLPGRSARPIRC